MATLSGRSSPPKVSSLGVGDRSGRRGGCLGMASLWRRSSSIAWVLDLLVLLPESFRSPNGSVDLERRRKPREDDLRWSLELEVLLLWFSVMGGSSWPRPGVEDLGDAVAMTSCLCRSCSFPTRGSGRYLVNNETGLNSLNPRQTGLCYLSI